MHYYQHHIGDFIRDTANLTDSQVVSYLRLIWMYYDTEAPLPDSAKLLAFKVGSDQETIELLLESFFKKEGDFWRHTRIESEISSYREKGEKARENANKRWNKSQGNADAIQSQCDGNADAMQTQGFSSKVDANQEPITNIKTPPLPPQRGKSADPKPPKGVSVTLPNVISADQWKRWIAFRKALKKPVSQETAEEQIKQLVAWAKRGHDPNEILATSIRNSWQGLFEPKSSGQGNGFNQKPDNSAPAKVRRAIAEREARRQAEGTGPPGGEVIDGEFTRTAF